MGILRADRITGLGGANAIKGSVEFRAAQNIRAEIVNSNADFNLGSGAFTIECWWNSGGDLSTDINFVTLWNWSSDRQGWGMYWDADDGQFGLIADSSGSGGGNLSYRQAAGFEKNKWYHLAIVRISNTLTLYKDGTSIGSNSSFTGTIYENTVDPLVIGGQLDGASYESKIMRGFISNLRIIKGEGIYTGNFTPPTNELTVTPNTVLLACQSPGDILQEETGKKLIVYRKTINDVYPVASRFTPNSPVGFSTTSDVGSQYGATFDGFGSFATSTYMVPPGGNTRERNRGRGLLMGGAVTPGGEGYNNKEIRYFDIASGGITETFGETTVARRSQGALSSSTRGCLGGGFVSTSTSPHTVSNVIDFVTIASTGNAADFGDMQDTAYAYATASNQTRGLFAGGYRPDNSAVLNTIDLITIATAGNASNFGDLVNATRGFGGAASTTRGVFFGGTYPAIKDNIDFVTFSTTGDATDFGNLTDARDYVFGSSSSTRAVMGGGRDPSVTNIIDFITIASAGNATDFGDLTSTSYNFEAATGNSTRAVWVSTTTIVNSMEYVTIATTGNAADFGDQNGNPNHSAGACSDSHGGL